VPKETISRYEGFKAVSCMVKRPHGGGFGDHQIAVDHEEDGGYAQEEPGVMPPPRPGVGKDPDLIAEEQESCHQGEEDVKKEGRLKHPEHHRGDVPWTIIKVM
jgi:hypothetical protein